MRATIHNGRTGKDGAYNTRHNDRQFDISHAEHKARDSRHPPACFCTRMFPDGRNNLQETAKNSLMRQPG